MDEWDLREENALGLIDFSSENDSLVIDDDSLLHHHNQPSENWKDTWGSDFLGSINAVEEADTVGSGDQLEQVPDLTESSEPDIVRKKGNCNLRKSLAWDSAFFTSAGVLDPEELSCMIGGPERSKYQALPSIVEDVGRSTDSVSTLSSDKLTVENVEAELFEDIRASLQKSSKKFNAPSKEASKKCPILPASRKMDPATQNQVKPKTALRKPELMSKALPKPTLRAHGPVKATKQHSLLMSAVKSTDPIIATTKSPHQIIGKGRPTSAVSVKRDSLSTSQGNKTETDKLKTSNGASKAAQDIKVASNIVVRRALPKPALSSRPSVSSSLPKTGSTRSSADSSGSYTSEAAKYPLAAARRKIGDRPLKPPSGSTLKTPIKSAANNRTATRSSGLSACLKTSKISSGVSPPSSISEWSSASSTSSCTINQNLNKSRASFDASSCGSVDNDSLLSDLDHPSDHTLEGCENGGIGSRSAKTKISSGRSGTLAHPASAKPSGLRMPSPAIGFFDGVKSVRTPNGPTQTHGSISATLPKSGAVVSRVDKHVNPKAKTGKHLNTQKSPQVMTPEVLSHRSDKGPSDVKSSPTLNVTPDQVIDIPSNGYTDTFTGSKDDINVIASEIQVSNPWHEEGLLLSGKNNIIAEDSKKDLEVVSASGKIDQKESDVSAEQQE